MDRMRYLEPTYDPIIIKSDKMIHIHMTHVHVKFQRGNTIFKPIIIAKHIPILASILNLGAIMDRTYQNLAI